MLKKILIIGSVFFLAGVSTLSLLSLKEYNRSKVKTEYKSKYSSVDNDYMHKYRLWLEVPEYQRSEFPWDIDSNLSLGPVEEFKLHQDERFLAEVDNLNDITPDMYPVAKLLYGDDWQQKLESYNKHREYIKAAFILTIIATSVGFAMAFSSTVILLIKNIFIKKDNKKKEEEKHIEQSEQKTKESEIKEEQDNSENKSIQALLNCHPYSTENDNYPQDYKIDSLIDSKSVSVKEENTNNDKPDNPSQAKLIEMLRRRKESQKSPEKLKKENPAKNKSGLFNRTKSIKDNSQKKLKEACPSSNSTVTKGEVIHETLNKLTEEVAAMRRYAGQQQERLMGMREIHDWNIIRNFALRIIRCVDNLEIRISELTDDDPAKYHLEEIKDELIFALESSGLEQYEPDINSEYRGQEKTAEALKEKQQTKDKSSKGRIAEVLKRGYRYIIDDENYKVVRAAQVKLFG